MISGLYSYVTAWKRGKHLLEDRLFRIGADAVDGNVRPFILLFVAEADADGFRKDAVDEEPVGQGKEDGGDGPPQLGDQRYSPHAAEELLPEDAGGDSSPRADDPVERPDAEDVIDEK